MKGYHQGSFSASLSAFFSPFSSAIIILAFLLGKISPSFAFLTFYCA
jgi:hypothetical protein